jgi:mono/diheme cytochrome c family protein
MTAHSLCRGILASLVCAALGAATVLAGGWAVITVDDLPEYVQAGEPFTIAYTVRQHGQHLIDGLSGRIDAAAGERRVTTTAERGSAKGQYTASLTLPAAGEWSVTIHGGFGSLSTVTLPILAVTRGAARPEPLDAATRGRQLFAAKGCVTCHRVDGKTTAAATSYGPVIVPQKYQSAYLAHALANPSIMPAAPNAAFRMPNLGLRPAEIDALVSFINEPRSVPASAVRR